MRQLNFPPCVIIAVNQGTYKDDYKFIRSYGIDHFKALIGSYKGETENSYLIITKSLEDYRRALLCARAAYQESILFLRPDRSAFLEYIDSGSRTELGQWVEVSRDRADALDAWTLDPATGRYYVAEGV